MSQVIAGTYEIGMQIGAGGGGIVYLGRHLRLDKQIVLKADKRTLNTKPEKLRREVDMLKGLSHTYIPQVYDFVQDQGAVYTVMDYIDGESLDKCLKRGELPDQPQIIRWACQLLEALCYLHSRPPYGVLHGDIKPANIMLRPSGDICLIDYNIALVLGENGAVKVGRSRGYASPEHYGAEFGDLGNSGSGDGMGTPGRTEDMDAAEAISETEPLEWSDGAGPTELMGGHGAGSQAAFTSGLGSTGTRGGKQVTLDARSDIYSLGATLYHLLSGHCPAQNAADVKPLGPEICSPQVSKIIQKAMAVSPGQRYQSAEEMLAAFRNLHKRDIRVIRHKRRMVATATLLSLVFLAGGASSLLGAKQLEQIQQALALAEYSANTLDEGNVSGAVALALQAIPGKESILDAPVTAQAQKALTDALGVYDLSDGFKALDTLELPSAPFGIQVSPNGTRFAVAYAYEAAVFDTESLQQLATLSLQNSALSDVVFVDEDRLVYAGDTGVAAYDLDGGRILWTGGTATGLAVSADGTRVAAVNRDEDHAVVYRMDSGDIEAECSFEGQHMQVAVNDIFASPNDSVFALNGDGSMLAVTFDNGGLWILDVDQPEENLILYDESDYRHFEGGFCGKYFAFTASGGGEPLFGLIDTKEAVYLGGYESPDVFSLTASEAGIYLANGNVLVQFDPDTQEETELAYTDQEKITGFSVGEESILTATDGPGFAFYDRGANRMSREDCGENCDFVRLAGKLAVVGNRSEPSVRLLKLEDHKESLLLSYDARYAHDEARVSQDGETVMLFDYEHFRVYDRQGEIVADAELPEAANIYDQQFRRSEEGSWLEVIWYDGTVRCYSGADGSLLSEEMGEPPAKDLYEEFYTDQYRIASSLHGAPQVYDRKRDKKVAELEGDSYLTYVTQVGEYIITEYISAAGERYGLLLDGNLRILARLPRLCDVVDGMLVFDYESGNLRQCRLYSLQELMALGEAFVTEN